MSHEVYIEKIHHIYVTHNFIKTTFEYVAQRQLYIFKLRSFFLMLHYILLILFEYV